MTALSAHAVSLERLDLRLLGRPRVLRPGLPDHLLERRDAALLMFLALNGAASRKQMAESLWPDVSERMALTNLRQRLFRFKRSLAADLFAEGEMLALRPGLRHDLDVGAEPQLLSQEALPLGALNYLDCQALAERVEQLQQQWLKQRRSRAAERAEALEAQGHLAQALIWAQHLTLNEPSSEHAHRRVMRLHYRRGDRAAALAAYRACQQRLLQDLGVLPVAETQALAAMIERSGTALLPPPAAAVPPRPRAIDPLPSRPAALAPALAAALWRPPQLIGREAEWRALAGAAQSGQLLLLCGEAGIGKTRLAQDFCASFGAGQLIKASAADVATPYAFLARWVQVLWAHATEKRDGRPELPSWALAELARFHPAVGQAADAPLQPLRLQHACTALLQACQGSADPMNAKANATGLPWLLLDDVQWIDAASLECLLPVLAAPKLVPHDDGRAPLLRLMTVRSDEALPAPLRQWIACAPDGLFELTLGPLAADAVAAFVQSLQLPEASQLNPPQAEAALLATLLAKLQRRTGGRPLFILELLRSAAGGLAQAVAEPTALAAPLQALIAKRVAGLSAPAQRLLRVAALLGPRFRLDRVAAVLAQHPVDLVEPWVELQSAQFMSEEGFAFDLAAEVAASSVPPALARLLHAAIAPVLHAGGVAAAVVAEHWQQAQAWGQAAQQWQMAAQQALQASRRVEELGFLARAEQCLQRQELPAQADLFDVACVALQAAMVVESAAQVHARLAALLALAQGDAQRLQALLLQARYAIVMSGQGDQSSASEALRLAQLLGDAASAARAVAWLGIAMALMEQAEQGLSLFAERLDWVQAQPDARLKLDFLGAYGYVLHGAARYQLALAPLAQAAALAEALGDLSEASDQLCNLAVCQQMLGQRAASLLVYERIHAIWQRMGRPGGAGTASSLVHVATSFFGAGRYAEALDLLDWCLTEFRQGRPSVWSVIVENRLAQVYLRLGQWARARQVLTPLPDGLRVGNRIARLCLESRLDALSGQAVLPRLLQAEAEWIDDAVDLTDRCLLALNILRFEAAAQGLARCDRLLASLPADFLSARLSFSVWRADALRRLGRSLEAAQQAEQVLTWIESINPLDMERVECWWLVARAFGAGAQGAEASLSHEVKAQAHAALALAKAWIAQAQPCVPAAFVPSFLDANPFNRQVLGAV